MHELDILNKESNIGFMKLDYEIFLSESVIDTPIFESGEKEGIFDRIISAICTIIDNVRSKIETIFTGKKCKDMGESLKKDIEENPAIRNEKVSIKDYKKQEKLATDTLEIVVKTNDEEQLKAVMKKYRKQRAKLIAGAALITVSIAAVSAFLIHGKNEKIKNLEQMKQKATSQINALKKKNDTLQKNITELNKKTKEQNTVIKGLKTQVKTLENAATARAKVVASTQKASTELKDATANLEAKASLVKKQASAITEVVKDMTGDLIEQTNEVISTVSSSKTSASKKVSTVVNAVKGNKGAVGEAKNRVNKTMSEELRKKKKEYKEKLDYFNKLKETYEKSGKNQAMKDEIKERAKELRTLRSEITLLIKK